jgi:invasion protein IalB
MRAMMLGLLIVFATLPAVAQDGKEPAKVAKEYKPPPGYKTRHRGDSTIYCRKSTEIGSRFKVEKCFTQEQLKEELARQEAIRQEFEKQRRICSNPNTCGSG